MSVKHTGKALIFAAMFIGLTACTGSADRQAEYLARAQAHFDAGNYDKASVDVRNALQINGDNVDARYLYALLFEKKNNLQEMVANLRFVIDLDPTQIPARIKFGTILVAGQMTDEALEQADAVLALDPEHAEAYALKSAAYFRDGETDLAITAAETALGFEPGNVSAVAVLTQIHKTEDPALALEIIRQGIEQQSELAVLKLLEISVYEASGDIEAASSRYKALTDA
jgi:tetratricopeptide (TPR) repeat protein